MHRTSSLGRTSPTTVMLMTIAAATFSGSHATPLSMTTLAGLPVQGMLEALEVAAASELGLADGGVSLDLPETLAGNTHASGIRINYIIMATSVASAEAVCADVGPGRCSSVFHHISAALVSANIEELSRVIRTHRPNLEIAVGDQRVSVNDDLEPPPDDAEDQERRGATSNLSRTATSNLSRTRRAATWGLNRINKDSAPGAGANVRVYVLDTGVRCTHTQFEGRCGGGIESLGTNPPIVECSCPTDGSCAADTHGHGTHCAGTIAGIDYGVAPGATILPAKVLGDDGYGYTSWSIAAEQWILANRSAAPTVVSMSLGGPGNNYAEKASIDALVADGITVVVAAGNESDDACNYNPAFMPDVITVGSTTSSDGLSYFSNYGTCVDILAPGSSILSAGHTSDTETAYKSGTSMACPHVSGAAAIALSLCSSATPADVLAELLDEAEYGAIASVGDGTPNTLLQVDSISMAGVCTAPPTGEPVPVCGLCVDTYPPSQTVEACATTPMARFTAQCNRRPTFVSSYMDQVDSLSVTACADLCLSRFSCQSFTHKESDGRCQLYPKPYTNSNYHTYNSAKTMYRLTTCIPDCPTSGNIMDRYSRAADFRTVTCVDDGNGNGGNPCTLEFTHPAPTPGSTVYLGGYRPKFASDFSTHCQTGACSTLAGCAQACFDAGRTGDGRCLAFNFKTDDNTQCKFYKKAFKPEFLVEHPTKQFYHLVVGSNCIN